MYKRHKILPKVQCERIHAKKRALERFGITLNRFDLANIVEQIQSGFAAHVVSQSRRISVFLVDLKGKKAFAIYDKTRKVVVSFLDQLGDENITPDNWSRTNTVITWLADVEEEVDFCNQGLEKYD